VLALVISGAAPWVERGLPQTLHAAMAQAHALLQRDARAAMPALRELRTFTEKRATFRCTPGLRRPALFVAPGLYAAGDYVAGPYPATLEGAVRSAQQAVTALEAERITPTFGLQPRVPSSKIAAG
jgi:hypothetical protein